MTNFHHKVTLCIFSVALLTGYATTLHAQKAEFGLRFMPTFSKFNIQTSDGGIVKGEGRFGVGFGAVLGYNFSRYVGIQGEAIYSTYSQQYREREITRTVKLHYVNIPLLLSLNTGKSKAVNFNVVAGPQIGINVGSKLITSGDNGSGSQGVLAVKKGDLGFAYGAGLDFGLNPKRNIRLGVGYRGVVGLLDISDNSNTIVTNSFYVLERSRLKVDALYLGLSFLF